METRELKTWEMIKELMENPDKEFVLKCNKNFRVFMTRYGSIYYEINGKTNPLKLGGFVEQEWTEVKKPATFMEAVESGKRIKVEHPLTAKLRSEGNEEFCQYLLLDNLLYKLSKRFSNSEIRNTILRGEWYIE